MKPADWKLIVGDARRDLASLPEASVQTCVTSPPYWGLRDYGVAGQIGLEETLDQYVRELVGVFRGVARALKPDGTAWVNLGDKYVDSGGAGAQGKHGEMASRSIAAARGIARSSRSSRSSREGLRPKNKLGIPWRVAFALQDDGWVLRSDIIWDKANPMPESVDDRPTVAHEFIFMFSRGPDYFYDSAAAKERCVPGAAHSRGKGVNPTAGAQSDQQNRVRQTPRGGAQGPRAKQNASFSNAVTSVVEWRNWRDVWRMASEPSQLEHFAAFPSELPKRCIIAGTKPGDLVLDPFAGTGTTGVVALELGRRFVGVELNPAYAEMAEERSRFTTRSLFAVGGAA